jgi:hypothetical protein
MCLHRITAIGFALFSSVSFANITSFHVANPVGWMHSLPTGEMPGWSGHAWMNLEISQSNIWNFQFDIKDKRNSNTYTYKADFEQSSVVVELGAPISDSLAVSVELPYADRNGGFLDDFIDQFHTMIRTNRFFRDTHQEYGDSFIVRTGGVDRLKAGQGHGFGNSKLKMKWWFLKYLSSTPGACDCGMAVSLQAKFPMQNAQLGLSSGSMDYSALVHIGAPLFKSGAIWATSGVTKLGTNKTFSDWPMRHWAQMYELSLDIGIAEGWGLIMQGRYESPLFNKEYLEQQYTFTEPQDQLAERISSGWNGLTAWRGSESIGLRYRWGAGSQANFLFIEDWALGDRDGRNQWLYVNNAPDVMFLTQLHFVF